MARLSELTDSYYDPMGNAQPALPVEQPFVNNLKRVVITGEPEPELPVTFSEAPDLSRSSPLSNNVDKILNALFRDDEKRLQLWPEKLLRAGATAAGDVAAGKVPLWSIDNETGDVHTSPQMIEKAQEISALVGSGGLANPAKGATLNATPSLRPALRHKEKLYKGKPGQEHQDIIPDTLYNDFQTKAMRGDDLAEYNFGFVNDKGHFLSREDALKYGIDNGIIDPQAGKYGALTSTLMADSSKPGTAIEAIGKTGGADPRHFQSVEAAKFRLGQLQRDKAATKKSGYDVDSSDYMTYNTQIRALKEFIKNPEEFKKGFPLFSKGGYMLMPVDYEPEFKK